MKTEFLVAVALELAVRAQRGERALGPQAGGHDRGGLSQPHAGLDDGATRCRRPIGSVVVLSHVRLHLSTSRSAPRPRPLWPRASRRTRW